MAGFTPEETVYRLNFEGTELEGLSVRTKSCTIAEWNNMLRASPDTVTAKDLADGNDRMTEMFLNYVVSWNLEIPAGTPTPLTLQGFNQLGTRHGALILNFWQKAMTEVPTTSRPASSSGEISPEQRLGLVSSSESLPNLNEQS